MPSRLRDPSVYTSRRRYDSPEILRHFRSYVRCGRPAPLGARTGSNIEREYDRLGRAPRRRDGGGGSAVPRGGDSGGSSGGGSTGSGSSGSMWAAEPVRHGLVHALVPDYPSPWSSFDAPRRSNDQSSRSARAARAAPAPRRLEAAAGSCTAKRGQHFIGPIGVRRALTDLLLRAGRSRRTAVRATAGR